MRLLHVLSLVAILLQANPAYSVQAYTAPSWLPGGHIQTIYTSLFLKGPDVAYRRERWEWPDGDFVDADWVDAEKPDAPIVVLFHGLEGSSQSHYARDLMDAVKKKGWRGIVAHFRGCSGEPNRLPRAYHAGDTTEIETILTRTRAAFPQAPVYAVGVSLGGNAMLKWLGNADDRASSLVKATVAISAPVDMNAAGHALDQGFNRVVYTAHFLSTLKQKALDKAAQFPGTLDVEAIERTSTFREFDTHVTARLHGFRDAEDYWTRTSSKPGLRYIKVPTLLINARNDPFLPASALPTSYDVSPYVTLEQPDEGGHVAFPGGSFPGNIDWLPQRILEFLENAQP